MRCLCTFGMFGWRGKIGLITPPDNVVIEPELNEICPHGVGLYSTRLNGVTPGDELIAQAEKEAEQYGSMGMDVIAYACNRSSFYDGPDAHQGIVTRLEQVGDIPATTASTAVLAALEQLDVESVSVVSPYTDTDNQRLRLFFEENGIEVLTIDGLGLSMSESDDIHRIRNETARDTYARMCRSHTDEADAVVVVATNLPSIRTISVAETDLGIPVLSSNQAILWHMLKKLNVSTTIDDAGSLFSGTQ